MSALTLGVNSSRSLMLDRFGNLAMLTDEEAMAQYLTQRLSALVGEYRFDKTRGINYMTTVFANGKESLPALRASMLAAILNTEHVIAVGYLYLVFDGADIKYETSIATEYGQVAIRAGA